MRLLVKAHVKAHSRVTPKGGVSFVKEHERKGEAHNTDNSIQRYENWISNKFPNADRFLNEVKKLADTHGTIYVRWSPNWQKDVLPDRKSRDFVSGQTHSGLSAVPIEKGEHIIDMAKSIKEYGFLRMQSAKSVPNVYIADRIGTDSDGYASIANLKHLITMDKETLNEFDKGFVDAIDILDDLKTSERRLGKITDAGAIKITEESIEKYKSKLDGLMDKNSGIAKAHVKAHQRVTAQGNVVQVRDYDDKRKPKQLDLFSPDTVRAVQEIEKPKAKRSEQDVIRDLDALSTKAEKRKNDATDESIRRLRPAASDWFTPEEFDEYNRLQAELPRSWQVQQEAKARVEKKRAERVAAMQGADSTKEPWEMTREEYRDANTEWKRLNQERIALKIKEIPLEAIDRKRSEIAQNLYAEHKKLVIDAAKRGEKIANELIDEEIKRIIFENNIKDDAILDDEGRPIKVFHGSVSDDGFNNPDEGGAIYFTTEPIVARLFASIKNSKKNTPYSEAYLKIKKPLIITAEIGTEAGSEYGSRYIRKKWKEAMAGGYDGLIIKRIRELAFINDLYIIKNKNQIIPYKIHGEERNDITKGYQLEGKTHYQGIPFSIENRAGSVRSGTDPDGNKWETRMQFAYGKIPYAIGSDGESLDVFIGPNPVCDKVFIIPIRKKGTKQYDEDKVFLGFETRQAVWDAFREHYADARQFYSPMIEIPFNHFANYVTALKKKIKRRTGLD
jgi:hypothetical protein